MEIDVGSSRCTAPALDIPLHRHYDPTDAEDAALRINWAKFLFRAGYRLRYPQETTGTSVLLFHRFLIKERVGKHRRNRDVILTTCLFLAGKVTEAPRRLRDVINVIHVLTSTGHDEPPLLDKAYWSMKERIVEFEQVLLRTINFQVDPPDPYRLLLNYARSLRLSRDVTRTAWSIVNDSLFCPRALSASQPAVACAAIRLASNVHGWDRRLRWFSPAINRRKREAEDGRGGHDGGGREWKQGTLDQTTVGSTLPVADTGAAEIITLGRGSMTDYRDAAAAADGSASKLLPSLVANVNRDDGESCGMAAIASKAPENAGRERDGGASRSGEEGDTTTTPWWGLFDARDEEVELVCSELLALYRTHGVQDVGRNATSAHTAGEMAVGTRLNGPRDSATGARGLESSTKSLGDKPQTAR